MSLGTTMRRNRRCSGEGRKEGLGMGLDRGCRLDPKWIECRGRLREVAGCSGGEGAAIWLGGAESKVEALMWIWIGRIPRAKGVGRVAAGGMGWMGHGEDF